MKNLGRNDMLSINQYVPPEFHKRYREISAICKIYRENGNYTHIWIGNYDYNVYVKNKDDKRSWKEIAPVYINIEVEGFEIGIVPKENRNKRPRLNEEINETEEIYDCDQCDYIGNSTNKIDEHMRYDHGGDIEYENSM